MNKLYEYHMHTSFCDGKNSPREIVEAAILRGFKTIGFSGHGYTDFDKSYCMNLENTRIYIDEISKLRQEFADKIEILCGIEKDYFSDIPTNEFDYVIGSVHYLYIDEKYIPIDMSADEFKKTINICYNGDFSALAIDYFKSVSDVVNKTNCDIIGHFDLITKFQNKISLDKGESFFNAGFAAIESLIPYGVPFEINVGAIARGYRNTPYPSKEFLSHIHKLGGDIVITGDCHDINYLGANYEVAVNIAKECGFNKRVIFTKGQKQYIDL